MNFIRKISMLYQILSEWINFDGIYANINDTT